MDRLATNVLDFDRDMTYPKDQKFEVPRRLSLLQWGPALAAVSLLAASVALGADGGSAEPQAVAQYAVFERQVPNAKAYSNPFDFRVIELQTEFKAPSGRKLKFFGYFDGDGKGGQAGTTWAFRCMPDEVGTWQYRYSWSDGTPGGSGRFEVVDSGLLGPLSVARDNPWYFMTAGGEPFHARPYGMHHYLCWTRSHRMSTELQNFKEALQTKVVDRGYNMVMWPDMGDRLQRGTSSCDTGLLPQGGKERQRSQFSTIPEGVPTDSWWLNATDTRQFSIATFRANEEALAFCRAKGVYVFTFSGLVDHWSEYSFDDFQVFLRYFLARMGPYCNYFGWSPSWEWMDIWRPDEVTQIMQYIHEHDPWKRLLTAHDNSYSTFAGWLGFSMRQAPAHDVFVPNSRRADRAQIHDPNGGGGIGDPFIDRPIIGSEDQWESPIAEKWWPGWAVPRNGIEAMRSSWGTLMAGVIPLYDEWNVWTTLPAGHGQGERHVRRMFDFWYTRTKYRRYKQLNELVSRTEEQIASGIPGEEYVVYDQNAGSIVLDLPELTNGREFQVVWFDPVLGAEMSPGKVRGGARQTLVSPFAADSVLFLQAAR
ncbi:MAG: DUF5060 domain-containing protein [Planctomycetaceae bacterium]